MKNGFVIIASLLISFAASAKNIGSFDMSAKEAQKIKSLIVVELKKESVLNKILENCFEIDLTEDVNASDLVILPVTQSFREKRDEQGEVIGQDLHSNILVGGIGKHLGNKGQTYLQCLLNTEVQIIRSETSPSQISVDVTEAKLIGEVFSLTEIK